MPFLPIEGREPSNSSTSDLLLTAPFILAGVSVDDEKGAVTVPSGIQQALKHRALVLPAEQPSRLSPDDHPGGMPPGVTDYGFPEGMRLARRCRYDDSPMQAVVVAEDGAGAEPIDVPPPEALGVELLVQQVHHRLAGLNLIRLRGASTDGHAH